MIWSGSVRIRIVSIGGSICHLALILGAGCKVSMIGGVACMVIL